MTANAGPAVDDLLDPRSGVATLVRFADPCQIARLDRQQLGEGPVPFCLGTVAIDAVDPIGHPALGNGEGLVLRILIRPRDRRSGQQRDETQQRPGSQSPGRDPDCDFHRLPPVLECGVSFVPSAKGDSF